MFEDEAPLADQLQRADHSPWDRCFVRLLDQVWQVDMDVTPTQAWVHFADGDMSWFRRYMALDAGDAEEESEVLAEWMRLRTGPGRRLPTRNRRLLMELEGLHEAFFDKDRPTEEVPR